MIIVRIIFPLTKMFLMSFFTKMLSDKKQDVTADLRIVAPESAEKISLVYRAGSAAE